MMSPVRQRNIVDRASFITKKGNILKENAKGLTNIRAYRGNAMNLSRFEDESNPEELFEMVRTGQDLIGACNHSLDILKKC